MCLKMNAFLYRLNCFQIEDSDLIDLDHLSYISNMRSGEEFVHINSELEVDFFNF